MFILYEETLARYEHDFATLLADNVGRFEAISSEASTQLSESDRNLCCEAGIEVIEAITPWMDDTALSGTLKRVAPRGTVYLSSSSEAGGRLAATKGLAAAARRAKAIRHDIKIVAGLGIRTAADVARIAEIEAIDAVVIGSAFVAAMADGEAEHFICSIAPALQRTAVTARLRV